MGKFPKALYVACDDLFPLEKGFSETVSHHNSFYAESYMYTFSFVILHFSNFQPHKPLFYPLKKKKCTEHTAIIYFYIVMNSEM